MNFSASHQETYFSVWINEIRQKIFTEHCCYKHSAQLQMWMNPPLKIVPAPFAPVCLIEQLFEETNEALRQETVFQCDVFRALPRRQEPFSSVLVLVFSRVLLTVRQKKNNSSLIHYLLLLYYYTYTANGGLLILCSNERAFFFLPVQAVIQHFVTWNSCDY